MYKPYVWNVAFLSFRGADVAFSPRGGDYDPLPKHFSLELKSLVSRLLAVDPEQRLNLAEALKEEAPKRKAETKTGEKHRKHKESPRFL